MLEKLVDDLRNLSTEELREVQRVVDALRSKNADHSDHQLHYFGRFTGIEWDSQGQVSMQLGPFNENTYGVAQGGAVYTLADVAIGFEILRTLSPGQQVLTLEMKMNFLKKGTGDKLTAQTEFLHRGKSTAVAQCSIVDQAGSTVAHAIGTFFITDTKNQPGK